MGGHVTTLRYLVEEARVQSINVATNGEPPLHMAVIWGRAECAAYLLANGALLSVLNDRGQTALEKARVRQARLLAKEAEDLQLVSDNISIGRDKIHRMCVEGLALVNFLEGVEAAGSYHTWVRQNRHHPYVARFTPTALNVEPRLQLAVLRALVLAYRAVLRPLADQSAVANSANKSKMVGSTLLEDAMEAAGIGKLVERLQMLGPFRTVGELCSARLGRQRLNQVECTEPERRRLWRFLVELGQQLEHQASVEARRGKRAAPSKSNLALAAAAAQQVLANDKGKAAVANSVGISAGAAFAPPPQPLHYGVDILFCDDMPGGAFVSIAFFLF